MDESRAEGEGRRPQATKAEWSTPRARRVWARQLWVQQYRSLVATSSVPIAAIATVVLCGPVRHVYSLLAAELRAVYGLGVLKSFSLIPRGPPRPRESSGVRGPTKAFVYTQWPPRMAMGRRYGTRAGKPLSRTSLNVPGSTRPPADTLRLYRQLGQLFIMGFDGTVVSDQVRVLIEQYHVGSILLTAKNLKCAAALVDV